MVEVHAFKEVGTVNYKNVYNDLLKDYIKLINESNEL